MHELLHVGGTFGGHVLPGAMLSVWALVWAAQALGRGQAEPAPTLERGWVVPLLKVALPLVGVWVEIPGRGWDPADVMANWQHVTMYGAFALSGGVDLLARSGRLSPAATYLAYAGAHANAGFLFWGHAGGAGVPHTVHRLLVLAFALASSVALLEAARPGKVVQWTRIGTLLLVGVWFMVAAWILYRSGWDLADPVREGWSYLAFSWSALAVAVFALGARLAAGRRSGAKPLPAA
jgi:hypothetical protein